MFLRWVITGDAAADEQSVIIEAHKPPITAGGDTGVHIRRTHHKTGDHHDRVEDQRRAGQHETWDIVHNHVEAGEAAVHNHLAEHLEAVAAEHLQSL